MHQETLLTNTVHPRMRGEHFAKATGVRRVIGSSPHARGTRVRLAVQLARLRFIPACAGNTGLEAGWCRPMAVHPRMRGEHTSPSLIICLNDGSSPHARGTHRPAGRTAAVARFIPACAGNTRGPEDDGRRQPVHPRMRGEHGRAQYRADLERGSSPHARGTLQAGRAAPNNDRFIPACAGNTAERHSASSQSTVHPRMRGEHFWPSHGTAPAGGSSPHARGTLAAFGRRIRRARFIPACAGNTQAQFCADCPGAVHPRMRGEHVLDCAVVRQ